MIKHKHPEFPSDIFMLLETAGAELSIGMTNFRVIYSIEMKPYNFITATVAIQLF